MPTMKQFFAPLIMLALLPCLDAAAANINANGASLNLAGPAYWSHTVQDNANGASVIAAGCYDEGGVFLNAAGAAVIINPLNIFVGASGIHSADQNGDGIIGLTELLRVIQFFNITSLHCDPLGEDGFNPGVGDQTCAPHSSDYNPQNWVIGLNELLRLIQFFNLLGYYSCPSIGEDDFCPGFP